MDVLFVLEVQALDSIPMTFSKLIQRGSPLENMGYSSVREELGQVAIKTHNTFRNRVAPTERGHLQVFLWLSLYL
jgi:hypothetical protein